MHVELYPHGGNYGFRWEDFYTKRGPRVWREMLVASPNLWQFACTWYNSGGQSPGKTLFCPLTKTSLSLPCRGGCGEMPPEPQILYVVECGVICRICRSHCAADSSVFIDPTHAWEVSSSYAFALRTGAPKVSCGIPHCTELRTYARLDMAKKKRFGGFPFVNWIHSIMIPIYLWLTCFTQWCSTLVWIFYMISWFEPQNLEHQGSPSACSDPWALKYFPRRTGWPRGAQ